MKINLFLLLFCLVLASPSFGKLVTVAHEKRDFKYYRIELHDYPEDQAILFRGGFGKLPFEKVEALLKKVKKGKTIHLYLGRGTGGSVREHKKFINSLKRSCSKEHHQTCFLYTYLDGQCSSMCATLYLSGDIRFARDAAFSNIGLHRTTVRVFGRSIPIQSVNSMARYFKEFEVNRDYLERHKERLFNNPNNGFYRLQGQELLDSGFAHTLDHRLDGTSQTFLKDIMELRGLQ